MLKEHGRELGRITYFTLQDLVYDLVYDKKYTMSAFKPLLATNFIEEIYQDSYARVKADRMQFLSVYDLVNEYCKKNKLIISAAYKLIGEENCLDAIVDFDYKIYSSNPLHHANSLTNALHEARTTTTPYIKLKTVRENREFVIEYDTRPLIKVYKLQKYHDREPHDIIIPTEIDGLYYIPSEIELIDIYHEMYRNQDFEKNLRMAHLLFKQVSERKERGILGGKCMPKSNAREVSFVKNKIFYEWIPKQKDQVLLLGAWLFDLLSGRVDKANRDDALCEISHEKIQIMHADKPAAEVFASVRHFVNSYLPAAEVEMREQELHIPKDSRTSRYTFYINKKPFMDLFNNLEFEIIPYHAHGKYYVVHKWVALRFLFVDLWIVRVIKSMDLLSAENLSKKLAQLWEAILFFKERDDPPYKDFLGTHIDRDVSKKIANLKEKMFMPYYPELAMKEKGKYRVL